MTEAGRQISSPCVTLAFATALAVLPSVAFAAEGYGVEDMSRGGWLITVFVVVGAFIASAVRPWAAFLVYFWPLLTAYNLYQAYEIHSAMIAQDLPAEYIGDISSPYADAIIRLVIQLGAPILAFLLANKGE